MESEGGKSWVEAYGNDPLQHPYLYILFLGMDGRGDYVPCRYGTGQDCTAAVRQRLLLKGCRGNAELLEAIDTQHAYGCACALSAVQWPRSVSALPVVVGPGAYARVVVCVCPSHSHATKLLVHCPPAALKAQLLQPTTSLRTAC